jgi:putative transposase
VFRIARVVIPGIPHHVVQRGNRRQKVFFNDEDRVYYLRLLKKYGDKAGLSFWAYCLMPNHVHMIAVPKTSDSLAEAMAAANWRYALAVNFREDWRGCLWQGRFYSCPLDQPHLIAAARYIERNPVRSAMLLFFRNRKSELVVGFVAFPDLLFPVGRGPDSAQPEGFLLY